jgi:hypothetical protein
MVSKIGSDPVSDKIESFTYFRSSLPTTPLGYRAMYSLFLLEGIACMRHKCR